MIVVDDLQLVATRTAAVLHARIMSAYGDKWPRSMVVNLSITDGTGRVPRL